MTLTLRFSVLPWVHERGRTRCAYLWQTRRKQLEEKTRFAAFFKTSCVRSTEYVTLADEVPSETGRLTKEEMQKKRQEYQRSKKQSRGMFLGDEEKADLCHRADDLVGIESSGHRRCFGSLVQGSESVGCTKGCGPNKIRITLFNVLNLLVKQVS